MHNVGDPIHGEYHGSPGGTVTPIPIYLAGSSTPYTLAANEWIEITSMELVTAGGGDTFVSVDSAANATPTVGTTVVRGTLAANSGLVMSIKHFTGQTGYLPYVSNPAGVVDVVFRGHKRQATPVGRPNWQAHSQATGSNQNVGPN